MTTDNKITNKQIKDDINVVNDTIVCVIGGILARITPTTLASKISGLITSVGKRPVRTVTATSYTATTSDGVIVCDASSNAITINIPASSELYDATNGTQTLTIIRTPGSSNDVTISPNGSEQIDEGTGVVLAGSPSSKSVISDGSNLFTHG